MSVTKCSWERLEHTSTNSSCKQTDMSFYSINFVTIFCVRIKRKNHVGCPGLVKFSLTNNSPYSPYLMLITFPTYYHTCTVKRVTSLYVSCDHFHCIVRAEKVFLSIIRCAFGPRHRCMMHIDHCSFQVQLGCNAGKLWKRYGEDRLTRDPKVVIKFPVDKPVKKVASPWGGLIVLRVSKMRRDRSTNRKKKQVIVYKVPAKMGYGKVTLNIDNAVESPKFVYGS